MRASSSYYRTRVLAVCVTLPAPTRKFTDDPAASHVADGAGGEKLELESSNDSHGRIEILPSLMSTRIFGSGLACFRSRPRLHPLCLAWTSVVEALGASRLGPFRKGEGSCGFWPRFVSLFVPVCLDRGRLGVYTIAMSRSPAPSRRCVRVMEACRAGR